MTKYFAFVLVQIGLLATASAQSIASDLKETRTGKGMSFAWSFASNGRTGIRADTDGYYQITAESVGLHRHLVRRVQAREVVNVRLTN